MAVTHMLLVEHWKDATASNVRKWRAEIVESREKMAAAVDAGRGLQGEYDQNLAKAWRIGRREAVERLAKYTAQTAGGGRGRRFRRTLSAKLPEECPYLADHVAAYKPRVDNRPRQDVWPPGVAIRFNAVLGTNYEIIREGPGSKGPRRLRDWSR